MRGVGRVAAVLAAAAALAAAAPAQAAPPPNDGPAGATEFQAFTADKGTPQERQGVAELAEAGADPGVPRCLGDGSFERTVWFRVPPAAAPQLVRVEGTGGSGGSAEVPDLAAFVQPAAPGGPAAAEAQACDGPAAQGAATAPDAAAAVELRVPAGRAVLVQAGRSAGQRFERIVLSLRTADLGPTPAGQGDLAADAPRRSLGRFSPVALGGLTLTEEDPAQPACPAAGTLWRRYTAGRSGTHVAAARGDAVGALTVFLGTRPAAQNAVACENRAASGADLAVRFVVRRGQTVWLRLGTDAPAPDDRAVAGLFGPGSAVPARLSVALPGGRSARRYERARRVAVRLRARSGALRGIRVVLERRVGRRFRVVARGSLRRLGARRSATVRLRRTRRIAPGRHRVRITAAGPGGRVSLSRSYRLRR